MVNYETPVSYNGMSNRINTKLCSSFQVLHLTPLVRIKPETVYRPGWLMTLRTWVVATPFCAGSVQCSSISSWVGWRGLGESYWSSWSSCFWWCLHENTEEGEYCFKVWVLKTWNRTIKSYKMAKEWKLARHHSQPISLILLNFLYYEIAVGPKVSIETPHIPCYHTFPVLSVIYFKKDLLLFP